MRRNREDFFVIALFIGLLSPLKAQFELIIDIRYCPLYRATLTYPLAKIIYAEDRLLPSISGYSHNTNYNTCFILLPPF